MVTPFLDRRHGTERCIVEQLERFAAQPGAEIHIYAQRVENLANVARYPDCSQPLIWHKVPRLPGPHLLGYLFWFFANRVQRWRDERFRGLRFEALYSPGINAFGCDAISVHVVFAQLSAQVRPRLSLLQAPIWLWPLLLHRRLYYRLICLLEKRIYPNKTCALSAISRHTAAILREKFQREDVAVIRYGVDNHTFHPASRNARRFASRSAFQIQPQDFCLLLIGNDWKNKGLDALLKAFTLCPDLPLVLLVVGSDDRRSYADIVRDLAVHDKVRFLDPSPDVIQFYAAADAYAGPSLEDAYGLPILEAMACGLPVIASARAGASEIVRHGQNGFVLQNPEDFSELAGLLRRLCSEPSLRESMAEQAVKTAAQETWDRNAQATWEFLRMAAAQKAAQNISKD